MIERLKTIIKFSKKVKKIIGEIVNIKIICHIYLKFDNIR